MEDRQTILEKLRQQSLYARAQVLSEQARNRSSLAPIVPSAAGAAGGGSNDGCRPLGGLTLTLGSNDGPMDSIGKIFLSEIGTENGKTLYLAYSSGNERGSEYGNWFKVAWDSDTNLWKFSTIYSQDGETGGSLLATSSTLYNNTWTMVDERFPPIGSSSGIEFNCNWRYCATVSGDGFSFTSSVGAYWLDIPLTEQPNAYSLGEGDLIFWSTEDSSWVIDRTILIGGTRDALPIGSFDISGDTLTINSGICTVEPAPTPEPTPPRPPFPPGPPASVDFIIRIDTTLGDGSDSFTVGANTKTFLYNYVVTWEEVGNPSNSGGAAGYTGDAMINFPSSGQYDISISGLFPAYKANIGDSSASADKVVDIIQWGDNQWQSMASAFNNCQNLSNYSATDGPDLSSVTDMSYMFSEARLFNGSIKGWDVSNVTSMNFMFSNAQAFNVNLSGWCVSQIPSEPEGFADGASSWVEEKPIWGTCP